LVNCSVKNKIKKMRPIQLFGHTRPITTVKYNREGDLLFTAARDISPMVWYSDNGERLGSYDGHGGSVYSLDVNRDSSRLITGSADFTARIWDVQTGQELYKFNHSTPVRSVKFSLGDALMLTTTEPVMGYSGHIEIHKFSINTEEIIKDPILDIKVTQKLLSTQWGPLNKHIIASTDKGTIFVWDSETGKQIEQLTDHADAVNCLSYSNDMSCFITASSDHNAKLFDARTYKCLKTYETSVSLNAASISPLKDHIILGGGQKASDVTTTITRAGNFQIRFYHKIHEEEIGTIKGHNGPINTMAFSPDGMSFTSGAEDGTVRIHHLDPSYFDL